MEDRKIVGLFANNMSFQLNQDAELQLDVDVLQHPGHTSYFLKLLNYFN